MKYLNTFEALADFHKVRNSLETPQVSTIYDPYITGGNIPWIAIRNIGEDYRFYRNGVRCEDPDDLLDPAELGDICYIDSTGIRRFVKPSEYDSEMGRALGVVVIPTKHCPDGRCRIVALKYAYTLNPEEGSDTAYTMRWGGVALKPGTTTKYYVDVPGLKNWSGAVVPSIDPTIEPGTGTVTMISASSGRFPSDGNMTTWSGSYGTDGVTRYYDSAGGKIPTPYLTNGDSNPDYRRPGSLLENFNGKEYTKIIWDFATEGKEGAILNAITETSAGNYPAACACYRYTAGGLSTQGDWYLPSCAELGYMIARVKVLNESLTAIGAATISVDSGFWSSSESSSSDAWYCSTNLGSCAKDHKTTYLLARPFSAI